jgi:16S rRNA (cytosine1402-N4)-methyltransferase
MDIPIHTGVEKNDASIHVPVLLHEIIEAFSQVLHSKRQAQNKEFWCLDGTVGGAGHALALASAFQKAAASRGGNEKLNVIAFDRDPQAIARAQELLAGKAAQLILENADYRDLDKALDAHQILAVDFILLDLGISSDELDRSGRGFTFLKDEPLHMTMGDPADYPFTARDIVNGWKEEDIANVIFGYGEDRYARRIAHAIVAYREKKKIETTMELAEIVKGAVPKPFRSFDKPFGKKLIHPATKTFQALRIAVNDELGALKEGLAKGFSRLAPSGRMAVISFHSLEDRIVKEFFKEKRESGEATILTKKPIVASPQEIAENPRSRSAKLRIVAKK